MVNSNQGNGGNQGGTKGSSKQSNDSSNRGFASMDPEQQREIAAEGGRAAHAAGTAHEFTSEEARKAGSLSHKNAGGNQQSGSGGSGQGGARGSEGGSSGSSGGASGSRGGTPEQHAEAGRQSHKNSQK